MDMHREYPNPVFKAGAIRSPQYLESLSDWCNKRGLLLIVIETLKAKGALHIIFF